MGVAKSWVYTARILVLANSHNHNHNHHHHYHHHKHKLSNLKQQNLLAEHHHCLLWPPEDVAAVAGGQRRRISWTVVCGVMLFVVGLISFFMGHVASDLEWCSHKVVAKRRLLKKKVERFSGVSFDLWESNYSKSYYGCSERSPYYAARTNQLMSNGYLLIAASGGLNQQRTGITDAVVVARILNATLVIPELDHHSYWKDDSDFANIFDVDWFISSLAKDVTIVKKVPEKTMRSLEKPPYTMRVPRKSEPKFYLDEVLPILVKRRVLQLTKFDYRLANDLDEELQRMRCRVNYHALRFTKPIQNLGQKIVMKMRKMAPRFIAVHLRFEPDMLAFSGCYYGGGDKERNELGEIRKRWTTLPETSPDGERKRGKCPLTPHEVGLMLRALGFDNNTYLYVASGEIYGGEETLKPLRELFPNLYTKETLASEELEPFLPYSSRLAAIDYIVCDESDVFVTNNNGNMAKILAGRRRYMGHKRTIRPNAKKLNALFLKREKMPWESFAKKVKAAQQGFLGEPNEIKTARGEFHEYPSTCICKKPFMFSDLDRDYNKNLTLTRSPEPESEYGRNEEDQGVHNVQNIENAGLIEIQGGSPSIEEKDGVDFLAD